MSPFLFTEFECSMTKADQGPETARLDYVTPDRRGGAADDLRFVLAWFYLMLGIPFVVGPWAFFYLTAGTKDSPRLWPVCAMVVGGLLLAFGAWLRIDRGGSDKRDSG